jgi:hypothetical protein
MILYGSRGDVMTDLSFTRAKPHATMPECGKKVLQRA